MVLSLSFFKRMKINKKSYLTRLGRNYAIHNDDKIIEKWSPKKNSNEHVLTMKVFARDLHVTSFNPALRPFKWLTPEEKIELEEKKQQKRGQIKKFSFGSVKRLRFLLRNIVHKMEYEATLTYPNEFPNNGLLVKEHFHKLRQRLNYYGYKFVWVLEFQERGAPHFHLLLNKEIREEELAKMWFKIVGSGDLKHLKHGVHVDKIRSKDGMAKYFATYIGKQEQKNVPLGYQNVGRFWGSSIELLECTIKKYYGNVEDIQELKKQLRPIRRWFDGQKRSWSNKRKFTGVKGYKNKFVRRGASFKVIHSDLFVNELKNRGLDISLYEVGIDDTPVRKQGVSSFPPQRRHFPNGDGSQMSFWS